MAGIGLVHNLSGIGHLADRVKELEHLDTRSLFDVAGATMVSQTHRRIKEDQRSPEGDDWPALSDHYRERKEQRSSGGLLEFEGYLLSSLTHAVFFDGSGVEVGSNLIYAATHQLGDEERKIKARPYLGLSADDEQEVDEVVAGWLQDEVLR